MIFASIYLFILLFLGWVSVLAPVHFHKFGIFFGVLAILYSFLMKKRTASFFPAIFDSSFIITRIYALFFMTPVITDVVYYFSAAMKINSGDIPYIDLPFEYPPLALIPIYFPLWFIKVTSIITPAFYRFFFMLIMFFFDSLLFLKLRTFENRNRTWLYLLLSAILLPLSLERLDVAMTYFMFMGAMSFMEGKQYASIAFLTIGGWFKLIPFIGYAGVLSSEDKKRTAKEIVYIGVINLIILTILSFFFYSNLFDFLKYHSERSFQIESIPASIALALSHTTGFMASAVHDHGAWNVAFNGEYFFLQLSSILLFLSFAFFIFLYYYSKNLKMTDLFCALIFSLLIFAKVLSPQYLIWLLPFYLYNSFFEKVSRIDKTLLVVMFLGTMYIFTNYMIFIENSQPFWIVLLLRNMILVYLGMKFFYQYFKAAQLDKTLQSRMS